MDGERLNIDSYDYRALDRLVTSESWENDTASLFAGWEILLAVANGLVDWGREPDGAGRWVEPIDHWELCDRIGFPRVLATAKRIRLDSR